jgi:hypothetical protein
MRSFGKYCISSGRSEKRKSREMIHLQFLSCDDRIYRLVKSPRD